jgi:hypothetical protein
VGIFSLGASTFIEASVVRGTQTSMDAARGVNVQVDPQSGVPATVTLKRSVVESNEDVGVRVWGGQLEIDGSIIRDIRPVTDIGGRGIDAYTDPLGKAAMWIHGALIDGVYDAGITGSGAEATVFATVVRNVSPEPLTGAYGRPISFDVDPVTGGRSLVAVQHSLLEKSIGGVQLAGSDGVLEGVLIRDASSATEQGRGVTIQGGAGGLHPQSTISMRGSVIEATKEVAFVSIGGLAELDSVRISDTEGMGVSAQSDVMRGRVTMFNSLVERAVGVGAGAYGADIAVHECAVRDVSVDVTGMLGRGLTAQYSIVTFQRATIDVQSTLVERTLEGGIIVLGADGLVANSIFRDSVGLAGGRLGDGVMVSSLVPLTPTSPVQPETASIGLEGCRIQNSARAGVSTFGGQVSLKGNRITCQAFDLDRENLVDLVGEMLDQGGNQCGCPDADSDCKLVSVNLEAPAPLDE